VAFNAGDVERANDDSLCIGTQGEIRARNATATAAPGPRAGNAT